MKNSKGKPVKKTRVKLRIGKKNLYQQNQQKWKSNLNNQNPQKENQKIHYNTKNHH